MLLTVIGITFTFDRWEHYSIVRMVPIEGKRSLICRKFKKTVAHI